jgi:hypothetical protein
MLTPAEEMGLGGLSLASRVRKAFNRIPEGELAQLLLDLREEMRRRRALYLHDGEPEVITVMACPITALPDQVSYVHAVTLTIQNALKRLPDLYMQDTAVRDILRLQLGEEKWLCDSWGASLRENNPIFGRYDAVIDFLSPMWKESLHFVEPNMSGIGGLHMVPTAERLLSERVLPALRERDPQLQLETGADIRQLLMQELLDHLEALGRRGRNICFVDPKYAGSGPEEQEEISRYYHDRFGLKLMHADPRELTLRGEDVYYQGDVVDLAYRDYPLFDLLELEKTGVSVEPMRLLFRKNRVVSSVAADLDQKSCWEVLTDPHLLRQYFTAEERQVFRRHILWTRILSDRKTVLPDGQEGDLLTHVRRERETLVLKPNRSFGGQGVLLGVSASEADWDEAIQQALQDEDRWVVQRLASIPVSEFPVLGPDGTVHIEPFYVVMGFAPTPDGVAFVGRASQKQVVNVAQRGGLCVVAFGHPPGRLVGPGPHRAAPPASRTAGQAGRTDQHA